MRKLKKSIVPPGRWHFKDRPYGAFYSMEKLIDAEINYRLENHLTVGDVEGEITDWICQEWPSQCTGLDSPNLDVQSFKERMVDRVSRWAAKWAREGFPMVMPALAEQRGAVCAKCPMNVGWERGCGVCTSHAQRMLAMARQARDVRDWLGLKACKSAGWCNRTAIWQAQPPEANADMPAECWLRPK